MVAKPVRKSCVAGSRARRPSGRPLLSSLSLLAVVVVVVVVVVIVSLLSLLVLSSSL